MPKPKAFQKKAKGPSAKRQSQLASWLAQTANIHSPAADLEEEAGGKWRAGDQAKSARAFQRAVEIYDNGLARHPKSFDLAYNKARLQLELSQQPALVAKLPISLYELLNAALDSHRYALGLQEEWPDVMFNTAQVMISLAELITEDGSGRLQGHGLAVDLLQQALELLDSCFSRQEMLLEEQLQVPDDTDDGGGVSLATPEPGQDTPSTDTGLEAAEQSVTIVDPVTPHDLLDTARASLSALTLLVSLATPTSLPTLSAMGYNLTERKIPAVRSQLPAADQAAVAAAIALERASFVATLASADHAAAHISLADYSARLDVFATLPQLATHRAAMRAFADALVEFSAAAIMTTARPPAVDAIWTPLTRAGDLYKRSLEAVDEDDDGEDDGGRRKAQTYEAKGDVEMLRFRLKAPSMSASNGVGSSSSSGPSSSSTVLEASARTLLKNAQTFYRGSTRLFQAAGDDAAATSVQIRGQIAAVLEAWFERADRARAEALKGIGERAALAQEVVGDMRAEGLVADEWEAAFVRS